MTGWKTLWYFPLVKYKTGWFQINMFVSTHGTIYRWRWNVPSAKSEV